MIDVAERLRSELQDLRFSVDLDLGLQPETLVGAGRRALTQRTTRRAVSGIAGALTVGLLSYGALSGRTLTGVPEPAQTTAVSQDGTASAEFELPGTVDDKYDKLSMSVNRQGDRLTATTSVLDESGMLLFSVSGEQLIDRSSVGGHQGVFYFAEQWERVGYRGDDGKGLGFSVSGSAKAVRMNYAGTSLKSGLMDVLGAGPLPAGATDPDVELLDPTAAWTSLVLGDRTLIVVTGQASGLQELATSVTYVDAAGKRVTTPLEP